MAAINISNRNGETFRVLANHQDVDSLVPELALDACHDEPPSPSMAVSGVAIQLAEMAIHSNATVAVPPNTYGRNATCSVDPLTTLYPTMMSHSFYSYGYQLGSGYSAIFSGSSKQ